MIPYDSTQHGSQWAWHSMRAAVNGKDWSLNRGIRLTSTRFRQAGTPPWTKSHRMWLTVWCKTRRPESWQRRGILWWRKMCPKWGKKTRLGSILCYSSIGNGFRVAILTNRSEEKCSEKLPHWFHKLLYLSTEKISLSLVSICPPPTLTRSLSLLSVQYLPCYLSPHAQCVRLVKTPRSRQGCIK